MRVSAYGGNEVRVTFDELVRLRDAEVTRRLGLFGAGNGFAGVFGAGPLDSVAGQGLARIHVSRGNGLRVDLNLDAAYSSLQPDSGTVPAFVTGRLMGRTQAGDQLAVAVNRRIAALTQAYAQGEEVRVSAMVSPAAFRRGANDVRVLAVSGKGPDSGATLARRNGGLAVVRSNGRAIQVARRAADGAIDAVSVHGKGLTVAGWATDATHRRSADRVLLFADNRLVQSGRPVVVSADVARRFANFGVARAGFEFTAVRGGPEMTEPGRLRVIAVVDGRGSELERR